MAARIGAHAHRTARSSPSRGATLSRSAARVWNVYNCLQGYTYMRTNIVIDDKLRRATLRVTGLKTKREAVEEGLRTLLRLRRQAGIRSPSSTASRLVF